MINWVKKRWTDPVWSKVFAGLILAVIVWLISKLIGLLNSILSAESIQKFFSKINHWVSQDSKISNLTLLLILLFIGFVITVSLYNLITNWWFGRTEKFFVSDSSYKVRGTYSIDLDLGVQAKRQNSDFWWQQKTKTERSLVPYNGAKFCVIGQSSNTKASIADLKKLSYSSSEIRADNNNSNQIPNGTKIAYITKDGRHGLMKVLKYGYDLEIEFMTLRKEKE